MSLLAALLAGTSVLVCAVATRPPSTDHDGPGPALWAAAAQLVRKLCAGRDARRVTEALPLFLEDVARGLRSGASMRASIAAAAPAATEPLCGDLEVVLRRLESGVALSDALGEWADRRPDQRLVRLVTVAVALAAQVGGSMAQAVDGVADTIRAEVALEAEVRALASQARASAALVALLPVAFGGVAGLLDARTAGFLLRSQVGLACLVGGVGLNVAGFAWMRRTAASIR